MNIENKFGLIIRKVIEQVDNINKKITFSDSSLLKLAKVAYGENELDDWAINYMKMDDPTFIGEGTGECLSSGLYVTAKAKLLEFDDIIQNTFINNTIGKYDAVLERYLAWARACGDETPFAGSGIVHNPLQPSVKVFGDNKIIYIALAVVTSLASFGALAFMLIRKSKKNKTDNR